MARYEYYELPCCEDDCFDVGCFRVWRGNGQRLAGEWCERHARALVDKLNAEESERERKKSE